MAVRFIAALLLLVCSLPAYGGDPPSLSIRSDKIDSAIHGALARGLIAGAVVLVGNRNEILFERAYGNTSAAPGARAMAADDIFDVASLTKVVATAPSILKLAEEGRVSLVDPVSKWFPEFLGKGKDDLLVLHLLTHTSGLDDFTLHPANAMQGAIERAANQPPKGVIGNRFRYADINFILLGEMVRRVTGTSLDQYAAQNIFAPAEMRDTFFNPDQQLYSRCSGTISSQSGILVGSVQDDNARLLGGVAGHAGLFSTAHDLAKFARMILREGEWSGREVMSKRAVRQMTAPYFSRGGNVIRGLGWDIASPFSSPRGARFSEVSFGHTGYSGGSIWIDPQTDLFVILLTARLEYRQSHTVEFNQLRRNVSSSSVELFGPFPWESDLLSSPDEQL